MESGSIVIALVKEYTVEAPRDLAICCGPIRITMIRNSYLFEKKVDNDDYEVLAHLKERHAVAYLLCEWVDQTAATELPSFFRSTDSNGFSIGTPFIEMNLRVRNGQFFCGKMLRQSKICRAQNLQNIDEYLRVLESESLNKNL